MKDLSDKNGWNLLILAANQNLDDLVQILINHDFDLNHEDYYKKNAIDHAWCNYRKPKNEEQKNKSCKIMEILLKANSKFPKTDLHFKTNEAPDEVRKFLDLNKSLRDMIRAKSYINLEQKVLKNKNLHHIYDINNKSIMAHAYFINNIKAITLFSKHGIRFGGDEKIDFYYSKMSKKNLIIARDSNIKNAYSIQQNHIQILLEKTKIAKNNAFNSKMWEAIIKGFEFLNSIPECSLILKIAATWKKLQIVFDFLHTSTSLVDPKTSKLTKGVIYDSGIVIIGAKNLMIERHRLDVLGTLIHELYHCAILITFCNVFDPYSIGESAEKSRYDIIFEKIEKLCKDNKNVDAIVKEVFLYDIGDQPSELIVRTIQIIVQYFKNNKIIDTNKKLLSDLFKYHEQVVLNECKKALPVLTKLNKKSIKYDELTEPMKKKILHTEMNFQGIITTFDRIFKNNPEKAAEVLINLPLDYITKLLSDDHDTLEFFDSLEVHETITRRFVEYSSSQSKDESMTLAKIAADVKKTKSFILADKAGTGKTATTRKIAYELIKNYHNLEEENDKQLSFVALIKLPNHYDMLKQHQMDLSSIDIKALLFAIINPKSAIEKAILTHLYSISKIIFIFDGVDKIYPTLRPIFSEILKYLKEKTNHQIWVSARPHLVADLQQQLQGKVYKFAQITKKEKTKFLKAILSDIVDTKNMTDFLSEIGTCSAKEVTNFRMIESIVEVLCDKEIKSSFDSGNHSEIFDKLIQIYADKVDQRLKPAKDIQGFSQERVHQAVALENLTLENLSTMIQQICLMKNWKTAKLKHKADDVQRHGIITAEYDQQSIVIYDFIHNIFAEYYVAQHIISFLYDSRHGIEKEEFKNIFGILQFITGSSKEFEFIHKFILSAVKLDKYNENGIFETMQQVMIEKMESLYEDISGDEYLISFWNEIFKSDDKVFNIFKKIFKI